MDQRPTTVITSGYFNPIHIGHLAMLQAARAAGDKLIVIVNNDIQQTLKKGKVIMSAEDRHAIVSAIGIVDEAIIALDEDATVVRSIEHIAEQESALGNRIIFGNGGDRKDPADVPEHDVCQRYGIEMIFDMGGNTKADSSTRINDATGVDPT